MTEERQWQKSKLNAVCRLTVNSRYGPKCKLTEVCWQTLRIEIDTSSIGTRTRGTLHNARFLGSTEWLCALRWHQTCKVCSCSVSQCWQSVTRQTQTTTAAAKNSGTDSNKSRQRQFVLICQTVNCGQMLSMQLANVILFFSQDVRESISSVWETFYAKLKLFESNNGKNQSIWKCYSKLGLTLLERAAVERK